MIRQSDAKAIAGYLPEAEQLEYVSFSLQRARFHKRSKSRGGDHDIPDAVPVFAQGHMGTCVVNAWCGALEILLTLERQRVVALSRMFLYWLCRVETNTLNQDTGSRPSVASDRITSIGVCSEKLWPYRKHDLFKPPRVAAYTEAAENKAVTTFRIDSKGDARFDEIEAAVRANHPVVFGVHVDHSLKKYRAGQVLGPPTAAHLGSHSMLITGVRFIESRRVFRVRNSWGPKFGDNGHLLMSEAALVGGAGHDFWVPTRIAAFRATRI